ncbi:hypothetical protein OS493_040583 [Desmophyllum pertusum]|uniref:Uncharacterized protein n=1 Tax=Desmophyllum pertusum TaxID=174260 RepID=A0A9X0CHB0_9CNID|nr:hypothetical protein OS493_040583 [Desmophyllum pertusum]
MMDEIPDQFLPYKGIFDCNGRCVFPGMLRWNPVPFPPKDQTFRSVWDTLLHREDGQRCLKSFQADAHFVLLFLQHLESIELYVREESQSSPKRVFQVKIADESLQMVRTKRKEFRAKITPGKVMTESVTVTYPITIETVKFDSPFDGGVAMALPTGPKLQTPDIKGHVFCFLPLPVQKNRLTGLPVHVNGFFALSQNRRYIKSPKCGSRGTGTGEDWSAAGLTSPMLWNKCLAEKGVAIPRALMPPNDFGSY